MRSLSTPRRRQVRIICRVFPPPTWMISADRIFLRMRSFEGCSLMRKRTSVLHFKKVPKYSCACFQYLSKSELAVGMKRSLGFFLCESRIISRSIGAVPRVLISPPPDRNNRSLALKRAKRPRVLFQISGSSLAYNLRRGLLCHYSSVVGRTVIFPL